MRTIQGVEQLKRALKPVLDVVDSSLARGTARFDPSARPQPRDQPVGSALTIVLPVLTGHEQELAAYLTKIGEHIEHSPAFPFADLTRTHFLRWVLLPPAASGEPTQLAFECNHDGTPAELLEELLSKAPVGMHGIYQHCRGYPLSSVAGTIPSRALVAELLLAQRIDYCAFYVGAPGQSVAQTRGEERIRRFLQGFLDTLSGEQQSALQLAHAAREAVLREPELSQVLARSDDSWVLHPLRLAGGVLAVLLASPALLLGLGAIFVKERSDPQASSLAIPDEARVLMAREDLQIQNQLTHLVPLKTGPLRALSTRVVLAVIDFLAHELFTRGQLGGISSIHFARWVLVDEGRRLLFFSNYDGSWESYLGDFIDKAATGLTSVWSNTELFPKSLLLAFEGATDEERFKAWTRAHQITTQLWYSAYPDLTVRNVVANRALCAQLRAGLRSERAAQAWLRHF